MNVIKGKRIMLMKRIIYGEEETWKILPRHYFRCIDRKYGLEFSAIKLNSVAIEEANIPELYKQCLLAWQHLKSKEKEPIDRKGILNELIWGNRWIKSNGTTLKNTMWARQNICQIKDILFPDGTPKYNDIMRITGQGQLAVMILNGVMSAIPSIWLRILRQQLVEVNELDESKESDIMKCTVHNTEMEGQKLTAKSVYECLNKSSNKNKWQLKWETVFNQPINWKQVFSFHKNDLLERKVKIFVWKSLNYGLNTKEKTKKMKIGNGKCSFCDIEDESVMHLFAECDFLRPIWHAINVMVRKVCNTKLYDLEQSQAIILGVGNIYIDFIIAYTKWIIWKARNMIIFEQMWFDTNDIYTWIKKPLISKYIHTNLFIMILHSHCLNNILLMYFIM